MSIKTSWNVFNNSGIMVLDRESPISKDVSFHIFFCILDWRERKKIENESKMGFPSLHAIFTPLCNHHQEIFDFKLGVGRTSWINMALYTLLKSVTMGMLTMMVWRMIKTPMRALIVTMMVGAVVIVMAILSLLLVETPILALTTSPTTMTSMFELILMTMVFVAIMMAMLVLMALLSDRV